ncbi:MAG: Gfo/Idh/MocA family oxidoreductase [Bryobacteraceae bacterium]
MNRMLLFALLLALPALAQTPSPVPSQPLRVAIAGLVHGHVDGFLNALKTHQGVQLVGIWEPDTVLARSYAERFGLADPLFFTDLETMLDKASPEAVSIFTSTRDHPSVVQVCAARHVHVMMEKPLAVDMSGARAIRDAAERGHIRVIVNYETTWYPSHAAIWDFMKVQRAAGDIRKMVAMDGHQGPKEIGVGPAFLGWLTDPVQNGAGALYDFGCYGANLMTWLMDNQPPLTVTAVTQQFKPRIYPRVDDEATVVLEYPKAQGIIQASWNWPIGRKDFEVYAERGYAIATGGNTLRTRLQGAQEETRTPPPLPADARDFLAYLTAVVHGKEPTGLSSLENNIIVTQILEAARDSARTGKRVSLR